MPDARQPDPDLARYARQTLYPPIGEAGQRRLLGSRALICGCGALGSVLVGTLARAGVGALRIVDRDYLEQNNLQRQVLFDEADLAAGLPKAVAAARKLQSINSEIEIEPVVADVNAENILALCRDTDIVLDGTDNFETRFLLNDAAVKLGLPWIYGGVIGAEGQTLTILPGETPCLRCLMADVPPLGTTATCDTAGVLAPIVGVIASIQAMEAIKLLSGHREAINRTLTVIDLWENTIRQVRVEALRAQGGCATCARGEFPWLAGQRGSRTAILCGRNAVQISPPAGVRLALDAIEMKLQGVGRVSRNPFLLRLAVDDYLLTIFPDGRAIIAGTDDVSIAKTLYAKYIGA